ncbi:copper amine oxidase [Aspergillus varians]
MSHPLDPITTTELAQAVDILRKHYGGAPLRFNFVDAFECPKNEVVAWLDAKKNGFYAPPPHRRARIYFNQRREAVFQKAIVDITARTVLSVEELPDVQGPVDADEYTEMEELCNSHPKVLEEVAKLKLPKGAKVINDPWAYGTDQASERRRLFQCYMYIVLNDDPEANHYSLPAPFSPVFDAITKELVAMEYLPTGETNARSETQPWIPVEPVEYAETIMGADAFRKDLKPLIVQQPEGPSFNVKGRQVSWQKWNFVLGWTLREGPVLHDVTYDGRSLFYRLSMSEMTVPYGDPRSPYHRKQAFDLGDSGLGLTSNSLKLGCDCLGHIKYFDGARVSSTGVPVTVPNVVCMHEVDDGIGWKHTNFRTGTSSTVRSRQLVIQCTATVANYEYALIYRLDQAANIHIEVRATGIVSTMPIAPDVKVPWGTIVAPGVLAVNHQHLFNVRIDPALDGHKNTISYDDVVPLDEDPENDPFGVAFKAVETVIHRPGGYDLDSSKSRTYKIQNTSVINKVSGKPVSYKFHGIPSQMMMMRPHTFNQKRGKFATKSIWVTKYEDDELYAAGEFTNQSREDSGLAVWSQKDVKTSNEDVVLWHTFAITHLPRPEDFPVMPHEAMVMSLKPANFFELNPSNDVPRSSQAINKSTLVAEPTPASQCCREPKL